MSFIKTKWKQFKTFWSNHVSTSMSYGLILNIAILVVLLLIACPRFEYDMDIFIQSLLNNTSGTWSTGMVLFLHVYIGRILSTLCETAPGIPWYILFLYGVIFVSLLQISRVYFNKTSNKIAVLLQGIFLVFVGYECYIRPSYIKTAAILSLAGMITIYEILQEETNKKIRYIFAIVALVGAGMISWKALLVSGILMLISICMCYGSAVLEETKKKKLWQLLVVVTLAIVVMQAIDAQAYKKLDGWQKAKNYRTSIEKIEMLGVPTYNDEIKETLKIDQTRYEYISQGKYITIDGTTYDTVGAIADLGHEFSVEGILKFFRTVPIRFIKVGMFYCFGLLWLFWRFSQKERKGNMFPLAIVMLIVAYFGFYLLGAKNSNVVDFLVLAPLSLFALINCTAPELTGEEWRDTKVFLLVLAVVLYYNFGSMMVTSVADGDMDEILMTEIENPETPWKMTSINDYLRDFSVFENYSQGIARDKGLVIVDGIYGLIPLYEGVAYPIGWMPESYTLGINVDSYIGNWMEWE